ncbi:MAG: adenine phosphoribosyltransferase [Chloroflexi bacterium]|nr:adenine phosphoribosyltransferase [Chloroflexota bacterium]OJV91238.1 MAG: adenine phosphoribosyltransferase [Chloroflexi bacterium 54-19]
MNLRDTIRDIPDFPQEGILFKDITTLLKNPAAFRQSLDEMTASVRGQHIDMVVGMESRGFIFGAPLADRLSAGFVPARKLGKLPAPTVQAEYALEYGTNTIEIHQDAIKAGMRVLIVDDLLATGGTAEATARLVEQVGGEIAGFIFLIELKFLKGRSRLTTYPVTALIEY